MSCCAAIDAPEPAAAAITAQDIRLASRDLGNGCHQLTLSVPDVHCGLCIAKIERALKALPIIADARVNLSTRRVRIDWRADGDDRALGDVMQTMARIGYPAHLETAAGGGDAVLRRLLLALGTAGFAAMNIMLLSVSVWSGADGATRDLFHWISALIAAPAIAFSGSVFFKSAFSALRAGGLNMDVPISLAVILAFLMSLYEVSTRGEAAYFDASVTLLFFLLAGRTLDHLMRTRALATISGLARLMPAGAIVLGEDGSRQYLPAERIVPGMRLVVPAGQRIPVDGDVIAGCSDVDMALVNGESTPVAAAPLSALKRVPEKSFDFSDKNTRQNKEIEHFRDWTKSEHALKAGTMNLTGVLTLKATARARDSFLAQMIQLVEAAQSGKPRYRRIADRAAALYAPAVHLIAALTFAGWMLAGGGWHQALLAATATLIITCPCALGLAVPMVQVAAASRLSRDGVLIKDAAAFEQLAGVDTVVFDKTGTLTTGLPRLRDAQTIDDRLLAIAAAMASASSHPYAQAISRAGSRRGLGKPVDHVSEHPGRGLEAAIDGHVYRLGAPAWCGGGETGDAAVVLSCDGVPAAQFAFDEALRPDAVEAVAALTRAGLETRIVSGDAPARVRPLAEATGIAAYRASQQPADKIAAIQTLQAGAHHVLMVGDGINDAPALSAADVSMAPARASDIGRAASGLIFLHASLNAVPLSIAVSRSARRLIQQNFALAVIYNMVAIPLAVAGLASPLVAAIAMSSSSILVVLNAMRLHLPGRGEARSTTKDGFAVTFAGAKPAGSLS